MLFNKYYHDTLVLLDGYDEIAPLDVPGTVIHHIINKLLGFENLIITSRPYSKQKLISFGRGKIDRTLMLRGFEDGQIDAYVQHYFKAVKNKPALASSLSQFLRRDNSAWNVAHIPIQLDIICGIWSQKDNGLQPMKGLTFTLTFLYDTLVCELFLYTLKKEKAGSNLSNCSLKKDKDVLPDDLKKRFQLELRVMDALAYQGLQNSTALQTFFEGNTLRAVCEQVTTSTQSCKTIQHALEMIGLIVPHGPPGLPFYEFIHFSVQEYFAARQFKFLLTASASESASASLTAAASTSTPTQTGSSTVGFDWIRLHKYNPAYQRLLRFIAGVLRNDNRTLSDFFKQLITEPRDLIGLYEEQLLIQCLDECLDGPDFKVKTDFLKRLTQRFNHLCIHSQDIGIAKHVIRNAESAHLINALSKSVNLANSTSIIDLLGNTLEHDVPKVQRKIIQLIPLLKIHNDRLNQLLIGLLLAKPDTFGDTLVPVLAEQHLSDDTIKELSNQLKPNALSPLEGESLKSRIIELFQQITLKATSHSIPCSFPDMTSALIAVIRDSTSTTLRLKATDALGDLGVALNSTTVRRTLCNTLRDRSEVPEVRMMAGIKLTGLNEFTDTVANTLLSMFNETQFIETQQVNELSTGIYVIYNGMYKMYQQLATAFGSQGRYGCVERARKIVQQLEYMILNTRSFTLFLPFFFSPMIMAEYSALIQISLQYPREIEPTVLNQLYSSQGHSSEILALALDGFKIKNKDSIEAALVEVIIRSVNSSYPILYRYSPALIHLKYKDRAFMRKLSQKLESYGHRDVLFTKKELVYLTTLLICGLNIEACSRTELTRFQLNTSPTGFHTLSTGFPMTLDANVLTINTIVFNLERVICAFLRELKSHHHKISIRKVLAYAIEQYFFVESQTVGANNGNVLLPVPKSPAYNAFSFSRETRQSAQDTLVDLLVSRADEDSQIIQFVVKSLLGVAKYLDEKALDALFEVLQQTNDEELFTAVVSVLSASNLQRKSYLDDFRHIFTCDCESLTRSKCVNFKQAALDSVSKYKRGKVDPGVIEAILTMTQVNDARMRELAYEALLAIYPTTLQIISGIICALQDGNSDVGYSTTLFIPDYIVKNRIGCAAMVDALISYLSYSANAFGYPDSAIVYALAKLGRYQPVTIQAYLWEITSIKADEDAVDNYNYNIAARLYDELQIDILLNHYLATRNLLYLDIIYYKSSLSGPSFTLIYEAQRYQFQYYDSGQLKHVTLPIGTANRTIESQAIVREMQQHFYRLYSTSNYTSVGFPAVSNITLSDYNITECLSQSESSMYQDIKGCDYSYVREQGLNESNNNACMFNFNTSTYTSNGMQLAPSLSIGWISENMLDFFRWVFLLHIIDFRQRSHGWYSTFSSRIQESTEYLRSQETSLSNGREVALLCLYHHPVPCRSVDEPHRNIVSSEGVFANAWAQIDASQPDDVYVYANRQPIQTNIILPTDNHADDYHSLNILQSRRLERNNGLPTTEINMNTGLANPVLVAMSQGTVLRSPLAAVMSELQHLAQHFFSGIRPVYTMGTDTLDATPVTMATTRAFPSSEPKMAHVTGLPINLTISTFPRMQALRVSGQPTVTSSAFMGTPPLPDVTGTLALPFIFWQWGKTTVTATKQLLLSWWQDQEHRKVLSTELSYRNVIERLRFSGEQAIEKGYFARGQKQLRRALKKAEQHRDNAYVQQLHVDLGYAYLAEAKALVKERKQTAQHKAKQQSELENFTASCVLGDMKRAHHYFKRAQGYDTEGDHLVADGLLELSQFIKSQQMNALSHLATQCERLAFQLNPVLRADNVQHQAIKALKAGQHTIAQQQSTRALNLYTSLGEDFSVGKTAMLLAETLLIRVMKTIHQFAQQADMPDNGKTEQQTVATLHKTLAQAQGYIERGSQHDAFQQLSQQYLKQITTLQRALKTLRKVQEKENNGKGKGRGKEKVDTVTNTNSFTALSESLFAINRKPVRDATMKNSPSRLQQGFFGAGRQQNLVSSVAMASTCASGDAA